MTMATIASFVPDGKKRPISCSVVRDGIVNGTAVVRVEDESRDRGFRELTISKKKNKLKIEKVGEKKKVGRPKKG
jgi:hypothetical protein